MSLPERTVLVLITGDPVPAVETRHGDFAQMIQLAAGAQAQHWAWRHQDVRDENWELEQADAIVVSGSPSSVTEALPWMLSAQAQLRTLVAQQKPVLGICFGHQLLAVALGGRVALNPLGREMGTVQLSVSREDPVVAPQGSFPVNSTHVDSVVELPPGAVVLGTTRQEPHAAVLFAPRAWGVQFHPEIEGWSMTQYLLARRELLEGEQFDVDGTLAAVTETAQGADVVAQFLKCARNCPGVR